MAECMDEEIPEEPLPLQQELTCSVCRNIFQNPVVLPCSHSFCRECLEGSTKFAGMFCPLCRERFAEGQAIPNRALSHVCQTFVAHPQLGRIRNRENEAGCNLHQKPLQLFCEKDEQPVCVDCVTLHGTHKLWPLAKAVPICKRELELKVQIFERKVELYKGLKQNLERTAEYIRNQAGEAEKQIQMEFQRLQQALEEDQHNRLKALAAEEERKIAAVQELTGTINKDIADLKKLIDTVKKEMGNEDLPLLQNFQDLKRRALWTREERCHSDNSLLNMGHHVGNLSFKIWKSLQHSVNYNSVAFDPNTSSPWLSVNADLTTVDGRSEPQTVPGNPERFDRCVFILGAEGYTSGKHRWDVVVGDRPSWIVGVCRESVARKSEFTLAPNRGVWCIGLKKGLCTAFTKERIPLQVEERPERIRIKLNMDKGEVSFWDAGSSNHLVTLTHNFNERIFPFFGPGFHDTPMILAPGKIAMHTS